MFRINENILYRALRSKFEVMETLTIDILNNKAIKLLQDLETLQLIRVRKEEKTGPNINWPKKYKGAMRRQTLAEVESQLKDLRK